MLKLLTARRAPDPVIADAEPALRKDYQRIDIQPGLCLEVYWKVLDIGTGPALILNAHGHEVLKFDFFGRDCGHYHVHPFEELRIRFIEGSAKDQIARARRELCANARYYLQTQPHEEIQRLDLDERRLKVALHQAEKILRGFLRNVDALRNL